MTTNGQAFIRTRWLWLAWYPLRGRKCMWRTERCANGWHHATAVGPLYLGIGPGTPSP